MNWIKVQTNLRTSPKLVRIASGLKWTPVQALGAIVNSWMIADEHATESGLLEGLTFFDLDAMISCPGLSEAMANVGWLKETSKGVQFVNYEEHNGSTAKSRAREQKRKQLSRKCPPKHGQKADTTRTREEKRREDKITNKQSNNIKSKPAVLGREEVLVLDQDDEKKRLAQFVNRTAEKLAEAYDSRPEWISPETKRNFYIEQKTMRFSDADVDSAVSYIIKHRQGKLGQNEPKIAQEAQSAMASIGKLIQRGAAYKAKIKPKKKNESNTYVAPKPQEITEEEREANLAMLKNLTKNITK